MDRTELLARELLPPEVPFVPDTFLPFREYGRGDPVSWSDLAVARRFLVERGLVEDDAFERLLQEPAA